MPPAAQGPEEFCDYYHILRRFIQEPAGAKIQSCAQISVDRSSKKSLILSK
jgi:hypothetical protein